MVTSQGVLPVALALFLTIESVFPVITLGIAQLSQVARRAGAISRDRIAGGPVPALAPALALKAIGSHGAQFVAPCLEITWWTLAVTVDMRADPIVLTAAVLGAVGAKLASRTMLTAVGAHEARLADARAIDRVAGAVVLAAASEGALRAIEERHAGPGASLPVPARLALALARPRVTHERIFFVTLTDMFASWSIELICAGSTFTPWPCESGKADAVSIGDVAACPIVTVTLLAAVEAIRSHGALVLAPFTHISRSTDALARQVVAQCPIVTLAPLAAVGPMEASWAGVGTCHAHPSFSAEAAARDWVTCAPVLAATLVRTLVSMGASWAQLMA